MSPYFIPRLLFNLSAGHIAINHGFTGPNHTPATACASGSHAIGDASRFIAFGDADVMVAGASEACISSLSFIGFSQYPCCQFNPLIILGSKLYQLPFLPTLEHLQGPLTKIAMDLSWYHFFGIVFNFLGRRCRLSSVGSNSCWHTHHLP